MQGIEEVKQVPMNLAAESRRSEQTKPKIYQVFGEEEIKVKTIAPHYIIVILLHFSLCLKGLFNNYLCIFMMPPSPLLPTFRQTLAVPDLHSPLSY